MSDGCTDIKYPTVENFYPNTEYYFLSNFYGAEFDYNGHHWLTSENAYQAAKVLPELQGVHPEWSKLLTCSPGESKKLGRKMSLRSDWEDVKIKIMAEILYAKFTQNPTLKKWLLATGSMELIEGNYWGDTYWGVCKGKGHNHLGKLLMRLRDTLRIEDFLGNN